MNAMTEETTESPAAASGEAARAAIAGGTEREKGFWDFTELTLGLVATIVVTAFATRIAGRALKEGTGDVNPADAPA